MPDSETPRKTDLMRMLMENKFFQLDVAFRVSDKVTYKPGFHKTARVYPIPPSPNFQDPPIAKIRVNKVSFTVRSAEGVWLMRTEDPKQAVRFCEKLANF